MTTVRMQVLGILLNLLVLPAYATQIIVVDDQGGTSTLPYYRSLNPQPQAAEAPLMAPDPRAAEGLPIRSKLTPGQIQGRVINAPGLQPVFIIGDDETSRLWLQKHGNQLQHLQAVGLIVNVETHERLAVVRSWANHSILMSPASGDDLAERLGLDHYPALITATAIEQ